MNIWKILGIGYLLLSTGTALGQKTQGAEKSVGMDFDECSFEEGYFVVNGVSYSHEEIIFLCLVDNGPDAYISITAYRNPDEKFPLSTEWSGPQVSGSGPIGSFHRNMSTSSAANPFEIIASYEKSGVEYSIKLNIVVASLEFHASNDQDYGFDDNKWEYTNTYPSNTAPSDYSWKSLKIGDSDVMDFIIEPTEFQDNVTLSSSDIVNFPVSPTSMSSNPQEVTVGGNSFGVGVITAEELNLGGCSSVARHSIVNVVPYEMKAKDIKFILVAEENDDEQLIDKGKGAANIPCIGPGANGLFESVKTGDDEFVNGKLTTGSDGIRNSPLLGDDEELNGIKMNQGLPNAPCIAIGNNDFWDTPAPPSTINDFLDGDVILAGPDGICQTDAADENINTDYFFQYSLNSAYDYLDKIYSGAIFTWVPESLPISFYIETINYDLDRDGKLDVGGANSSTPSVEMAALINGSNHYTPIGNETYIFFTDFAVDDSGDTNYEGVSLFNTDYAIVFPGGISNNGGGQSLFSKTITHEAGHAAFGLRHPWSEIPGYVYPGTDPVNVMDYGDPEEYQMVFRKYQWDQIHN